MTKLSKNRFFIMNIQLFAEGDVINSTLSTGLSVENKTFYDKHLIDLAGPAIIHDQCAQTKDIPKNGGKTIEFRKFAPLAKALTPLTEGVTPKGNTLTATSIEATVSQYGDYITQTDILDLTAIDNTVLEATQLLSNQASLTLDTITRNVLNSGTNVTYCSKTVSGAEVPVTMRKNLDNTSKLTVDMVMQIATKLKNANAPKINGKYVAFINPCVAYDLMRDPEWIDVHKYSDQTNIYNGEIGEIAGVRFIESTEAKVFAGEKIKLGVDADGNNVSKLSVNNASGYSGAITSVAFDGATVVADELIGKYIKINDIIVQVTDNTANSITFASTNFGTIADNTVIKAAECSAGAVFSTIFVGLNAYGTTKIDGGGLEMIIKQKGSAGTSDPLDQRSTIGWKAVKTAEILIEDYIVRVESVSPRFSATIEAN